VALFIGSLQNVGRKHFEKKALSKRGRSREREETEAKQRGEEVGKRN
jgi:hypothetical protein